MCARIECRDSLVRNIGDVIMAVAVLLAVFGVDAMEMRAVEVWWGREGEVGNLGYQNWKEKDQDFR